MEYIYLDCLTFKTYICTLKSSFYADSEAEYNQNYIFQKWYGGHFEFRQ